MPSHHFMRRLLQVALREKEAAIAALVAEADPIRKKLADLDKVLVSRKRDGALVKPWGAVISDEESIARAIARAKRKALKQ
jgi:hypothetical protein